MIIRNMTENQCFLLFVVVFQYFCISVRVSTYYIAFQNVNAACFLFLCPPLLLCPLLCLCVSCLCSGLVSVPRLFSVSCRLCSGLVCSSFCARLQTGCGYIRRASVAHSVPVRIPPGGGKASHPGPRLLPPHPPQKQKKPPTVQ